MCGIVGYYKTLNTHKSVGATLLAKMRDTMSHRGPNDAGIFISPDETLGMAHRRLSIIDLSSGASQPMANHDGSIMIVFNGEIYNHAALRQELEKSGHRFKSDHSDTEVIIKGYEAWGEEVLHRLRGMFAFAIWDKKNTKLWLARDRMGVKPLYYTTCSGLFLFASEIKALLEYPDIQTRVHEKSFYDFLTFVASPAPQTLFDGILKLPAGHSMTVYANGQSKIKRWWNPFYGISSFPSFSEDEWVEKIVHKLRESIQYRMVSDVNFGVFLSGGVDSSANVALMSELMNRPVDTFSVGYEGVDGYNELEYARIVAHRYKTRHHEILISQKDFVDFLPKLIHHQDEPIADPVCTPIYYLSKLARENNTTICQVGEGADELFCGYRHWGKLLRQHKWIRGFQMIPGFIRQPIISRLVGASSLPWRLMRPLELARRASANEPVFWGGAEAYQETTKKRLLSSAFQQRLNGYSSLEPIQKLRQDFLSDAPDGADDLHWMAYLDLRLRLPELLLMRVDKMTMAQGLEGRVPFLDQEFVQLGMSIPGKLKFKNKTLKYLLKKAMRPILPPEIIDRRKQGFGVPLAEWSQQLLGPWAHQKIIQFAKRTDYFSPEVIEHYVTHNDNWNNWFLLNFVLWHEKWIEKKELDLPHA